MRATPALSRRSGAVSSAAWSLTSSLLLTLLLASQTADAAAPYGKYDVNATYVYKTSLWSGASGYISVFTSNLTVGADTVMYLTDGTGTQVAWDDDGGGGLASWIQYQGTPNTWYWVYVRAHSNNSHGTADLYHHFTLVASGFPVAGYVHNISGSFVAGDTAQTALLNAGATDTVLYGIDGSNNLRVIDDDGGVGYTSKAVAPVQLSKIVVATYAAWDSGMVRLYLNDTHATDSDGDGLGPELEEALCTCDHFLHYSCNQGCAIPDTKDSDRDGIEDGIEAFGKEDYSAGPPQHLTAWGANPAKMDVFVEVDYWPGAQMAPTDADTAVAAYATAGTNAYLNNRDGSDGIAVHLDIGTSSPATIHGNWGGSGEVPNNLDREQAKAIYFSSIREGLFHYAVATTQGGNGDRPGDTFSAQSTKPYTVAHELGHNLDLRHGGSDSAFNQNGKPHYKSIMNYAFNSGLLTQTFSANAFSTATLNPSALCEADGLKTSDSAKVAYLQGAPFSYTVETDCSAGGNSNCGIDWNRDGTISSCSKAIQAAPNWQADDTAQPELGRYYQYRDAAPFSNASPAPAATPSMARTMSRFYVGYRTTAGYLKLLYTTQDLTAGCSDPLKGCASWSSISVESGLDTGGPSLMRVLHSGSEHLMAVFKKSGNLHFAIYNSSHAAVSSGAIPGATGVVNEPVLSPLGNDLLLLYRKGTAGSAGPVYANIYNGSWSSAAQQYAGGQPLSVHGVQAAAAYPSGTRAVMVHYFAGPLVFHYYPEWYEHSGNNSWTLLTGTGMDGHPYFSGAPPVRAGLAYIPHAASTGLTGGRWYFAYNNWSQPAEGLVAADLTQGDGENAPLSWTAKTLYDNVFFKSESGVDLLGWTPWASESRLRLATIFRKDSQAGDYRVTLRPNADGIANVSLRDNNDWEVMASAVCASLHGCNSPKCAGSNCIGGSPGEVTCE